MIADYEIILNGVLNVCLKCEVMRYLLPQHVI